VVRSVKTIRCKVKSLSAGDIFGAEEIIENEARKCSVTAFSDSEVLYINKASFF